MPFCAVSPGSVSYTHLELKVVVPQPGQILADYESLAFTHFYVQPMDGENRLQNVKIAIDTCLQNPKWKLSLQTHKYLQIDVYKRQHMAWYSVQAESNLKTRCAEEAVRGFRGEKPRNPVNKL